MAGAAGKGAKGEEESTWLEGGLLGPEELQLLSKMLLMAPGLPPLRHIAMAQVQLSVLRN
jgi:hypothetical protein